MVNHELGMANLLAYPSEIFTRRALPGERLSLEKPDGRSVTDALSIMGELATLVKRGRPYAT